MKMFLLLSVLSSVLLTGSISFAGPEDHIQAQACYTIDAADQAKAHSELPLELCFETLSLYAADHHSHTENTIVVYSYFSHYQQYLSNLKLTSMTRVTEYSYAAESVLVDREESHCEDSVKIILNMDGRTDFMGYGDVGAQNLTLTQIVKADTCHSNFEKNVFKYVRTR